MTARRTYTLTEAAAEIGFSVKTLRREINDGRIGARRVRGSVRIYAAEIERYLNDAPQLVAARQQPERRPESSDDMVQRLLSLALGERES